jgi:hypothetical protein
MLFWVRAADESGGALLGLACGAEAAIGADPATGVGGSLLSWLTIELTCVRRLAQPAGERQVERRVRRQLRMDRVRAARVKKLNYHLTGEGQEVSGIGLPNQWAQVVHGTESYLRLG